MFLHCTFSRYHFVRIFANSQITVKKVSLLKFCEKQHLNRFYTLTSQSYVTTMAIHGRQLSPTNKYSVLGASLLEPLRMRVP